MLRIYKVSERAATYYLATLPCSAAPGTRLLEPPAYWLGRASAALGLSGELRPEALRAVLAGRHPATGAPLLGRRSAGRSIAAYDCTFSSPKSVSLLFALGPPGLQPVVRSAHDAAVSAALSYLEREAARLRVGTADGRREVPAAGVVAAAFPHRMSRAPDPHLHTHVVVANLVPTGDGSWRALDARRWYAEVRTAAALYETHLRFELSTRARVRFRDLGNRTWSDVVGLDPAVVRAFSRRSAEISRVLGESGLGASAGPIVADATRPPKELGVSFEQRVEEWRERGYGLGLSQGVLRRASDRPPLPGRRPERAELDEALALALSGSRDRSFTRGDLLRARCRTDSEGSDAGRLQHEVDALIAARRASGEIVSRGLRGMHAGRLPPGVVTERLTTREVLAAERHLVEALAAGSGRLAVVEYAAGGRLAALDDARTLVVGEAAHLLAPGRVAASSAEALTGLPATSSPWQLPHDGGSLVVVDPHALAPSELETALLVPGRRRTVLVVPSTVVRRDELFARLSSAAHGGGPRQRREGLREPAPPLTVATLDLAGTTVQLAPSARAAVALTTALAAREEVLVTAGGRDVLSELRVGTALAGRVVPPAGLGRRPAVLARGRGKPRLVVLGGADELRLPQQALDSFERTHVLVARPGVAPGDGYAARAAELVRPGPLVRRIGVPRRDAPGRGRWRQEAAVLLQGRPRLNGRARDLVRRLDRGAELGR